jgi:hypothetical protein
VKEKGRFQDPFLTEDKHLSAKRLGDLGRKRTFAQIETEIVQWVRARREMRISVSYKMMAVKIMRTYPAIWPSVTKCRIWLYGIAKRHHLCKRRKTHNQILRNDEEELGAIHLDFVSHVRSLMTFHHSKLFLL